MEDANTLTWVGGLIANSNCSWSIVPAPDCGAPATYAVDASCTFTTLPGDVDAPHTNVPGFVIEDAPPGQYIVIAQVPQAYLYKSGSEVYATWMVIDLHGPSTLGIFKGQQQVTGASNMEQGSSGTTVGYLDVTTTRDIEVEIRACSGNGATAVLDSLGSSVTFHVYRID